MKNLVILTGLSCTLKDSVSDDLVSMGYVKFPDVNRNYIKTLTSIAVQPEMLNVTSKIPNIMLCANRLGIYNAFLDGFEDAVDSNQDINFVLQRTVIEHLFFPNEDAITLVDENKLIKAENEFLSRFDKVIMVLITNHNEEMLNRYYLTDEIRTSITKTDDKLGAYKRMQDPYMRFITKLRPITLGFEIPAAADPTSSYLTKLTKDIADCINERMTWK